MKLHLDTHVAVWLAAGERRRLKPAQSFLKRVTLLMSPFAIVEMEILREIGRLQAPVSDILELLRNSYGINEARGDLTDVVTCARKLGWTRDPFDRLIVAHALADAATLLTADEKIRMHCTSTCWGE